MQDDFDDLNSLKYSNKQGGASDYMGQSGKESDKLKKTQKKRNFFSGGGDG